MKLEPIDQDKKVFCGLLANTILMNIDPPEIKPTAIPYISYNIIDSQNGSKLIGSCLSPRRLLKGNTVTYKEKLYKITNVTYVRKETDARNIITVKEIKSNV